MRVLKMVKTKLRQHRTERARARVIERKLDNLTDHGFLDRISRPAKAKR